MPVGLHYKEFIMKKIILASACVPALSATGAFEQRNRRLALQVRVMLVLARAMACS